MSTLTLAFRIPGDPIAKARPRAANANGFTRIYTPTKSKDFEHLVKRAAQAQMDNREPLEVPLSVVIEYELSIPKLSGVRQRECRDGRRLPTTKPDLDNLIKSTLDGMNKVVYRDDVFVCNLVVSKRYSTTPGTRVLVEAIDAVPARSAPNAKASAPGQLVMPGLNEPF